MRPIQTKKESDTDRGEGGEREEREGTEGGETER